MTTTAPTFALTREQASRLQGYLQEYRRYAFASLASSVERNTTLRFLQIIQSKLIDILDHKTALSGLILAAEDVAILRTITAELLLLYAREPASAGRNATLTDLAALKGYLKGFAEGRIFYG